MSGKDIVLENETYRLRMPDPAGDDARLFTRYSYCGYICELTSVDSGEALLGSPRATFDPFSGEGFPDEFEKPVGYDEAAVGGEFLKIGIGIERKTNDGPYTNHDRHPVRRRGLTEVRRDGARATFTQRCGVNGYAYAYRKTVRLEGEKIVVEHLLENVGEKPFETLWYSHAFLPNADRQAVTLHIPAAYAIFIGKEYVADAGDSDVMRECKQYRLPSSALCGGGACLRFSRAGEGQNEQVVTVGDRERYRAESDCAADEIQLFANDRIVSAEPKIDIRLDAGKTRAWTASYIFG